MKKLLMILPLLALPISASAEVPEVVTDIAPVHGLVSRVMQGVGAPTLLVPQNASPHGYNMKVSQARNLEKADMVFWVGPVLAPWLEKPLGNLAGSATLVDLMQTPNMTRYAFRDEHDDHDEHGEEHHDDEHHDDEHHGDEHEEHEDAHGHHHGEGDDPHGWLDPENGVIWLGAIADALSKADPENAQIYAANAAEGQEEVRAVAAQMALDLAPIADKPFGVLHDGYQYFERRFGLKNVGTVLDGMGAAPGPVTLARTQEKLHKHNVTCLLTEPQLSSRLIKTVTNGLDVTFAEIDPLGADLELGPKLYPALLKGLAKSLTSCLNP